MRSPALVHCVFTHTALAVPYFASLHPPSCLLADLAHPGAGQTVLCAEGTAWCPAITTWPFVACQPLPNGAELGVWDAGLGTSHAASALPRLLVTYPHCPQLEYGWCLNTSWQ
jgi:hypothetical protein